MAHRITNPISVAVDGESIELGSEPEKVIGVEIVYYYVFNQNISKEDAKSFSTWLYNLCQKSEDDHVCFNGTLINKKDIRKYTN